MAAATCTLKVHGLDCPVEMKALTAALDGAAGVDSLGFDLLLGTMTVRYDPEQTGPPALMRRIQARAGMRSELLGEPRSGESWWARYGRTAATGLSGLTLAIAQVGEWVTGPSVAWSVAYLLAIATGCLELLPRGYRSLLRRQFDINVLMAVAVVAATILGHWDEAATVGFLFLLSESIEALTIRRSRKAIRSLLEVAPDTAERIGPDGQSAVIPATEILKGDRVRVRSWEKVPVDGMVLQGRSSVDQKAITGESVPVLREVGDEVFAGTVNGEGALEIEASGPLENAMISRIIDRVRRAQASRAPIERAVETFAAIYTPAVLLISLGIMIGPPLFQTLSGQGGPSPWSEWFTRGLIVLVIACPCALVIATPVAVVAALAASARRGVLVKEGKYLEELARMKVLAFDKTGTLTRGEPDVVEVVPVGGRGDTELLGIAAALGDRGGHVLGRAIARHARGLSIDVPQADPEGYEAVPGLGASGRVNDVRYHIGSHRYLDETGLCRPGFHDDLGAAETGRAGTSVALSTEGGPLGWIRLADRPRDEAAKVVGELAGLGISTVMLTGDNARTADAVAAELGITDRRAGLLPGDKAAVIAELESSRGPTGMIGDGVNDAPALAAARVSLAMGGMSSGAAIEAADIVLLADGLDALPWIIRRSRSMLATIRQNIVLALGVKLVVLILAAFGHANLWLAILADVGTSLIVTLNALRLLRK